MEHARGNPALFRQVAAAVRKGARASGLNLDAMELTDDGFVGAGIGAVEDEAGQPAAASPEPKPQVAAAREEAQANDTIVYAVGAAAAAGLIGGVWLARSRRTQG
jgi:hypothetical protein